MHRWLFVLWIRTFRRRYAVKKLVPFLRIGMMVYMSARAKRVVRTLFRQLRVMQTFARGFLLCTNSRYQNSHNRQTPAVTCTDIVVLYTPRDYGVTLVRTAAASGTSLPLFASGAGWRR